MVYIRYGGMFVTYLLTRFDLPASSGSLVTTIKLNR
jgi:hypothetical protein